MLPPAGFLKVGLHRLDRLALRIIEDVADDDKLRIPAHALALESQGLIPRGVASHAEIQDLEGPPRSASIEEPLEHVGVAFPSYSFG